MWVTKLGVEIELEVLVEVELSVTHLDVSALTLLDNGTSINWLNDSIDRVLQVLDEHWLSCFDSKLESLHHLWIGKTCDLEVILLFSFS